MARASDPYELAYQIDRLMRRMNAGLQAHIPVFDADRIGPIGGMILLSLAEIQPAPMQKLVAMMGRDKAQLSRTIAMLVRRELITKRPHESDARSSILALTPKGEGFVEQIKSTLAQVLQEILEPLDATERAQLLSLLRKT